MSSDLEGQPSAARTAAGLLDLSTRARLVVTGPDRQTWLQGMITNDVAKLGPGQGTAALALSNKGKIIADLRVFVRPHEIWIDAEAGRGPALLEHLSRFIIMEDCTLAAGAPLASCALVGARAWEIGRQAMPKLATLGPYAQTEPLPVVIAAGWPDLGLPGIRFWMPPSRKDALYAAFVIAGASELGAEAAEVLRIEAGRPRDGVELDADVIPLEAGLDQEISDSKGCYLGQEVIARISHRGHVNRKLAGFVLSGEPPALPAPLIRGDATVGELRSAARSPAIGKTIALGYVRREYLTAGTTLQTSNGGTAVVTELPFVK
jgi:folate-binding protein YgfZ